MTKVPGGIRTISGHSGQSFVGADGSARRPPSKFCPIATFARTTVSTAASAIPARLAGRHFMQGPELRPAKLAVAPLRRAAEQAHVRVGGDERIADLFARHHCRGAARPLEGIAVGMEAVGLPHA